MYYCVIRTQKIKANFNVFLTLREKERMYSIARWKNTRNTHKTMAIILLIDLAYLCWKIKLLLNQKKKFSELMRQPNLLSSIYIKKNVCLFVRYAFSPCNSYRHQTFHDIFLGPEKGRHRVGIIKKGQEGVPGWNFTQFGCTVI